ncbi:MAG: hypothetical protein Q4E76_01265 [Tissierellia bacterium]|nr:hypothetical protein [Tissierellia bacterium]
MKKFFAAAETLNIVDHHAIVDEMDQEVYEVHRNFTFWGRRVDVRKNSEHLFSIQKLAISFLPKYIVTFDDGKLFTINGRMSLFRDRLDVEGLGGDYYAEGQLWDYSYRVYRGEEVVGSLEMTERWGEEAFEITVEDESMTDVIISIIMAVDVIVDDRDRIYS